VALPRWDSQPFSRKTRNSATTLYYSTRGSYICRYLSDAGTKFECGYMLISAKNRQWSGYLRDTRTKTCESHVRISLRQYTTLRVVVVYLYARALVSQSATSSSRRSECPSHHAMQSLRKPFTTNPLPPEHLIMKLSITSTLLSASS
jgi:hypothetical protein